MKLYKVICSCGMEICDETFSDRATAEYEARLAQDWIGEDDDIHHVTVVEEEICGKPS